MRELVGKYSNPLDFRIKALIEPWKKYDSVWRTLQLQLQLQIIPSHITHIFTDTTAYYYDCDSLPGYPRDDNALMAGIALHGWNEWEVIGRDPALKFGGRIPLGVRLP